MNDTDVSNFLYDESLRLEPRNSKQPPKFVSINQDLSECDEEDYYPFHF